MYGGLPNNYNPRSESKPRKLNPRVCRGCGLIFMPTTELQRYGTNECKALGNNYQCRAVPNAKVNHQPGWCAE